MSEILRFGRLGSTQTEALERARAGAPPGTTITATSQDHGIGRLDHGWVSPVGGLYLSRIEADPGGALDLLPMALALELSGRLEQHFGVRLRIRWPNDLWVAGPPGKIAGILVDRISTPSGSRFVVGIGINVCIDRRVLPEPLGASVAILQERAGRAVHVSEVEADAIQSIAGAVREVALVGGVTRIAAALGASLDGLGREAELDGVRVGRIRGVDPSGALVTEIEGTRITHHAGSLRLLEEPEPLTEAPVDRPPSIVMAPESSGDGAAPR